MSRNGRDIVYPGRYFPKPVRFSPSSFHPLLLSANPPGPAPARKAAALEGVTAIVISCPKDVTMYREAVKITSHELDLIVKDLSELVYEAL